MGRQTGQLSAGTLDLEQDHRNRCRQRVDRKRPAISSLPALVYTRDRLQQRIAEARFRRKLDNVRRIEGRDQLLRCTECDQPAVIDNRHAVAQSMCFIHVMCGQQHCSTAFPEARDLIPELEPALRVQTRGRLVQEQKLRISYEGTGNRQSLPLSAGEFSHPCVLLLVECELPEEIDRLPPLWIKGAEQLQCFKNAELFGELRFLERDPDPLAYLSRIPLPVPSEDLHFPIIGRSKPLQNLDCRSLPGSIGAEKAKAFAAPHGQIQPVHRDYVVVAFSQPPTENCDVVSHAPDSLPGLRMPRYCSGTPAARPASPSHADPVRAKTSASP